MARKPVSAATKLKIARSLKGNKNAFKGGPKKGLSTREKIANINAATKAKKANLSTDQIARRQAVAKRLRAQARKEEALGGGTPGSLVTNKESLDAALAQSDRLKSGALADMSKAKNADDMRAATAKIKEARAALKAAQPKSSRKESAAKVQPSAKQNLNAPQKPAEQRTAVLSPAQRRRQQRSKFEADQAKARASVVQTDSKGNIVQRAGGNSTTADVVRAYEQKRQGGIKANTGDNVVVPGSRKATRGGDPIRAAARQQTADARKEQRLVDAVERARGSLGMAREKRKAKGARITSVAENRASARLEKAKDALTAHQFERAQRDKPQPPRSDTGTDRSGTFTKDVPINDGHNTRANGRKAIETEEDLQDFIAQSTPDIIRKLTKNIPSKDMADLRKLIGDEMGGEGLSALDDILKGR